MAESLHPTHLDDRGSLRMIDVGEKPAVARRAIAEGYFVAAASTLDSLMTGTLPKGEALAAARVAGVLAAKRCDELIPLCHTLPLEHVAVDFERVAPDRLRVVAETRITARTGVEMEALAAVALAALTLYDMTKGIDRALLIEGIRLVEKSKGAPHAEERRGAERPARSQHMPEPSVPGERRP